MMNMIETVENKNTQGFTLVEMAIGLAITGLILSFAAIAFSSAIKFNHDKATFEKMERIADAISIYAQSHMRVPCPAEPNRTPTGNENYGTEINARQSSTAPNRFEGFGRCDTIADAEGIVPFATLGLPVDAAKDEFGNFFTYRVSVTSALYPDVASTQPINKWCMTAPRWYADTNNDSTSDTYISPAKAAFCCGTWIRPPLTPAVRQTDGDIEIRGSFGLLPGLNRKSAVQGGVDGQGGAFAEYRTTATVPPTLGDLSNSRPPAFPAYILVSHGANGLGAYVDDTNVRSPVPAANVAEVENADGDNVFYATDRMAPTVPTGANIPLTKNDIDDLVFWETPSQVLGRLGRVSCARP